MFTRIDPKELNQNVFTLIGDQWMLITAGTKERCNTMTASWGGLGVLWGKPVATVYIRPQRYTMEFVEGSEFFTLAFFGEEYRKALDKVKECGFTVETAESGAPYFAEAELVLVCRKAYWQDMDPAHFLDPEIDNKWYPGKDYHRIFIGEIVEALRKE